MLRRRFSVVRPRFTLLPSLAGRRILMQAALYHTVRTSTFTREQPDHHAGMSFLFNQYDSMLKMDATWYGMFAFIANVLYSTVR